MNSKPYIEAYSKIQPIEVVYRPNERVNWGRNRKIYDGVYDLAYNHRTILDCEVVFDFDADKYDINRDNANKVIAKLIEDQISFTAWDTGNKGIHIHVFFKDLEKFKDLTLLKKTILKHYAFGYQIDYQLASKHLVRAENGINEKKRKNSKTIFYRAQKISDDELFVLNTVPEFIIEAYRKELNAYIARRIDTPANVDNQLIKDFLEGKYAVVDGREKFLYYLIHALKNRMTQEEVVSRLTSWYQYSNGSKLTPVEIKNKVRYHWDKNYSFGPNFFNKLMHEYNVVRKE